MSHQELSWRPAGDDDLPAIAGLAQVCLAADGGQPYAAGRDYLSRCYLGHAEAWAAFDGTRLVCVTSLRREPLTSSGDAGLARVLTTGLVHPDWRRRGAGGHAFDWVEQQAGETRLRAETETLNDGAHALYLSRGLMRVFAEDIMRLPTAVQPPLVPAPGGLVLATWGQADPARFHAVYRAAFRERPGFPGWSPGRWIGWISDDDFRAEWTLLASRHGEDVGFVAGGAMGWIIQLGVVPAARGQGIGGYLTTEVIARMRAAGETTIALDVNVNNPHAAALYRRLGFTQAGRRARYEAAAPTG
jgi:mycothiol synthase